MGSDFLGDVVIRVVVRRFADNTYPAHGHAPNPDKMRWEASWAVADGHFRH